MDTNETKNTQQKLGIVPWLFAILGAAAAIGSVVIAVTTILRLEIISFLMFMVICAPVFGFTSFAFGWRVIHDHKKAAKANK